MKSSCRIRMDAATLSFLFPTRRLTPFLTRKLLFAASPLPFGKHISPFTCSPSFSTEDIPSVFPAIYILKGNTPLLFIPLTDFPGSFLPSPIWFYQMQRSAVALDTTA